MVTLYSLGFGQQYNVSPVNCPYNGMIRRQQLQASAWHVSSGGLDSSQESRTARPRRPTGRTRRHVRAKTAEVETDERTQGLLRLCGSVGTTPDRQESTSAPLDSEESKNTELCNHSFMSVWGLFLLQVAARVHYLPGLNCSCSSAHQLNGKSE